jgi:hypothetical protein
MSKALGIGCGILLAIGVGLVVAGIVFIPRLIDSVRQQVAEEGERQSIAAEWNAPDKDATPSEVFPTTVGDYKLEHADRAAIPELHLDSKGLHAAYSSGPSKIEVFAYPTSKPEALMMMNRVEQAGKHAGGNHSWVKVDLGDYARVYLSTSALGKNYLWFTKGWLLVFRTRDAEDREPFVHEFLRTPHPPKNAPAAAPKKGDE